MGRCSHELRRVKQIQVRRSIRLDRLVKKRFWGVGSSRSELGKKRVLRVEWGNGDFGFVLGIHGTKGSPQVSETTLCASSSKGLWWGSWSWGKRRCHGKVQRGGGHGVCVCFFLFFWVCYFCFLCDENQRNYMGFFFFFPVLRSRKKWSGGEDCGWWVGLWMVRMDQSNRYVKNILYKMISNFIYQNSVSVKISTNKYVFY